MSYNPQNPNGQANSANSTPVVIASDQSAVPISASALPLPTGAATSAKQPALGTAGTPSSDVLTVQGASSMTALKVDGSGVTQPVSGSVSVSSSNGIGSAVPGNAFYKGLLAQTANPTAATAGNLVGALADKLGKQVVVGSIRDLKIQQQTTITSSTSETTVLTAVASTFLDVYGVIVTNTSATGSEVIFKDATAGTTRFSIYVPANDTRGFMLPESGAHNQAAVNNNWTATCGTSVASIKVTMLAVKNT